jgi:hypothetical protein
MVFHLKEIPHKTFFPSLQYGRNLQSPPKPGDITQSTSEWFQPVTGVAIFVSISHT